VLVAVVQFRASDDKADNLARLGGLIGRAAEAGAELIVCPEAAMHGFGPADRPLAPVAEPLDGRFVTGLAELADRHRVTVLAGMFEAIRGDRVFNTVVAVDQRGLIGRYRKLHLFDALGWVESDRLAIAPIGPDALLVLPVGDLEVGVLTCYDLRFPELGRALVDAGATMLAVPSAWVAGPVKEDQWRTLVRARAIENTCYVAAAGQPPPDYVGRSLVVDPLGVEVAGLADREGVAAAELTADRVAEVRSRMPSLAHRRFTVAPRP